MLFALKVLCQMHLSVVSFIGTSSRKLTGGFHSYRIKHLKHRHHAVVQSYIAPYKAPADCKYTLQAPPCINDDELNTPVHVPPFAASITRISTIILPGVVVS